MNIAETNSGDKSLQRAFEDAFRGHRIHALPLRGGSRVWDPPPDCAEWIDAARPWMAKRRDCKFYFSPAEIKPGSERTTKDDMAQSLFVWADLDPRNGKPLEAERAEILALLTTDLPLDVAAPTFIVDSGRGYWGFWQLEAPHVFDGRDGDATREFEAVLRGLANAFGDFGDRSVKNSNRIARLPSSINPKTGVVAEVIAHNPAAVYSLADFPAIVIARRPSAAVADALPLDLFKKMCAATPYTGGPPGLDDRRSYDGWLPHLMSMHEAAGGDCGDYLDVAIGWCHNDPEARGSWTAEKIQAHWESFQIVAGGRTRASWTSVLQYFGHDDLVSEATPSTTAEDDFGGDDAEAETILPEGDPEQIAEQTAERSTRGRTRAINKVRKLRAVNAANNSAPEEIAKAEKDAAKWIAKYNLTEDDINDDAPPRGTVSDGSSPDWYDIIRQWVYFGQQQRFYDLKSREMWDVRAFDRFYAYVRVMDKLPNAPLSMHIFRNQSLPMYKSVLYAPGNSETVIDGNFNTWMPSDIVPKEGDTTIIDKHMAYLFPDQGDRDHVLNYLAWVYANQHLKPRHWLLVQGEIQGTGKSFIAHLLTRLLGRKLPSGLYSNSRLLKGKNLDAAHNGWELETKVVVIEEVRPAFGSSNAAVKELHDLISEPTLEVDLKGVTPFRIVNYLAGILFSNKGDAVAVDNSDRRYLIVSVDRPTRKLAVKSSAYYDVLYATLEDPALMAAMAHQFITRDLKGYSGLSAAPLTAAKAAMVEETRDDLERWFDDRTSDKPLRYSLMTLDEVLDIVPNDLRSRPGWRKRVTNLLRDKLKGVNLGEVRFGGRDAPKKRLWSLNGQVDRNAAAAIGGHKALAMLYRTEHEQLTPTEEADLAEADARALAEAIAEFDEFDDTASPSLSPVDDIAADLM